MKVKVMGYGCMGDFYWEIEHIPDWNVIVKELPSTFRSFKNEGAALFISRNAEQIQYVNEKSLTRFENLFNILLKTLKQYEFRTEVPPINQWILIGAVAEVTLQIILPEDLSPAWHGFLQADRQPCRGQPDADRAVRGARRYAADRRQR